MSFAERTHQTPADDCAGCHMPQRVLLQFAHSALTDHRIVVREGQEYPKSVYQQSSLETPDLIYVNRPQDPSMVRVPDVVLLQAYGILAPRYPEFSARYLELLQKLRTSNSTDPELLAALGRYEMSQDTPEHDSQACGYFTRAVVGGASDPAIYQAWAEVLARSNRLAEAVDVLKSGIERAPWDEMLYKYLAWRLVRLRRYEEAKQTIAACVERFPQDDFMRNMLAQVAGAKE
jgi:tetratricopeptide (TPR) repeat protein